MHDCSHCIWCYANRKGRGNYRGHVGYRAPARNMTGGLNAMGLSRNRKPDESTTGGLPSVVQDDSFREKFPTLVDFLCLGSWEDGSRRQTGTILVFMEDGLWKCCLNDRDGDCYCFLASESFQGLLSSANDNLDRNSCEWRFRTNKGKKR